MFNHLKQLIIVLLLLVTSCKSNSIVEQIAYNFEMYPNEQSSFESIIDNVKDKRILILGETGHGDGKTFEIKSKLIEYLNANHEYDVVLEGMGVLDAAVLQGILPPLCIDSNYLDVANAWNALWSQTKEASSFVETMRNGDVRYWGMDCNPSLCDYWFIPYLQTSSLYVSSLLEGNTFDSLLTIHSRIVAMDTTLVEKELDYFDSQMNQIRKALEDETNLEKKSILNLAINNTLAFAKQTRLGFIEWEAQNEGINIRDRQMAENVKWYLDHFPERKVIIWTANLHGAKQINQINYGKAPDPDLYKKFVLLGEHLEKAFPGQVYSLAFTSGGGSTGYFFANDSAEIMLDSTTVEFQLSRREEEFGYCDLSKKSNWANKTFNSILLGYDCKSGKWSKVYDGIYYINKNQKAHEIERGNNGNN